jgi:uncharacterized membrane protein
MVKDDEQEITGEEIKKEFQLERMILFSDAVFAIVITLMAIEIRLPEAGEAESADSIIKTLHHLLPVFISYCVSFVFIGAIWYQHLRMFSLLKDYDRGLVIRNLLLLFFVSLFPFTSSVLTRDHAYGPGFFLYMGIILLCVAAQVLLYHYILVMRPQLRVKTGTKEHFEELRKRKISLIGFCAAFVMISLTYFLIPKPELKSMSMIWLAVFPLIYQYMMRKKRKKLEKKLPQEGQKQQSKG